MLYTSKMLSLRDPSISFLTMYVTVLHASCIPVAKCIQTHWLNRTDLSPFISQSHNQVIGEDCFWACHFQPILDHVICLHLLPNLWSKILQLLIWCRLVARCLNSAPIIPNHVPVMVFPSNLAPINWLQYCISWHLSWQMYISRLYDSSVQKHIIVIVAVLTANILDFPTSP